MRIPVIAAFSSLALAAGLTAVGGSAFAQEAAAPMAAAPMVPAAAPAPAGEITDAQLTAFSGAMKKMQGVAAAVQGGTPTAEQQAEMAAAVEASGLGIEQFNAISGKVSSDEVLRARLAVIDTPAPAAGSVAASVTDAEVAQFSAAMVKMREIAPTAGATPTTEQQAEMASTVQNSGLAIDRFNAIATAVSQDEHLRARVQLADAQS